MAEEEDLFFADDDDVAGIDAKLEKEAWIIMVVDDEEEVHTVTRLVLGDLSFQGRKINLLSARSGIEAKKLIAENPNTALLLLDVVMETDHAGLDVARYVREELGNHFVRIVLRTGQPGQAPEKEVIDQYDINDYKEKTELTAQKLYTLAYATLRSYRDIMVIENNKRGLEKIIKASAKIFQVQAMRDFAHGALEQMTSLLNLEESAMYCRSGLAVHQDKDNIEILAATGDFESLETHNHLTNVEATPELLEQIKSCLEQRKNLYYDDHYLTYFETQGDERHVLVVKEDPEQVSTLSDIDKNLIEVFCSNVGVAFENIYLNQEIEDTQREIVYRLGEAVETRSKETGNHVKRVALFSELLALKAGMSISEAEQIKLASPMHDLGKIGIPDAILNKPGKLDDDELKIMRTHAQIGYEILKGSKRKVLEVASIIANEHHEKYDGTGYPNGLQGENISLEGRISSIADVFDALSNKRCYKDPWPVEKVLEYFQQEKGKSFDPKLVDILVDNVDSFEKIMQKYQD